MARVLINLPAQAKRGEVIEIKPLIAHPMATGYRLGPTGAGTPRDIINLVPCSYNGEEVFRAQHRRMRVLALGVIATITTAAAEISSGDRRSGYDFAGPESRAMQDDDTANPGML